MGKTDGDDTGERKEPLTDREIQIASIFLHNGYEEHNGAAKNFEPLKSVNRSETTHQTATELDYKAIKKALKSIPPNKDQKKINPANLSNYLKVLKEKGITINIKKGGYKDNRGRKLHKNLYQLGLDLNTLCALLRGGIDRPGFLVKVWTSDYYVAASNTM